jgi:hypothetical protein
MVKDRFLTIDGKNIFTRISPFHFIDLYVGNDEQGRYAIKYRGKFAPESSVKSVAGIEVNQYQNEEFNTLQFSLTYNDNKQLFFTFCDDIIETTLAIEESKVAYKTILNRYFSWKKMFSVPKRLLTESEIMGLLGELIFLRDFLFDKYGKGEALKSWSGQELTHKDFSYHDKWYEVKAIHSGKNSVKISSFEQLQSDEDGELIVVSLEKMSASYDGIKINMLATEILNSIEFDDQKDMFLGALSLQGFVFNENYNEFVYALTSMTRYQVNAAFPKITRDDVSEAILKVQYDLSLAFLNSYIIDK